MIRALTEVFPEVADDVEQLERMAVEVVLGTGKDAPFGPPGADGTPVSAECRRYLEDKRTVLAHRKKPGMTPNDVRSTLAIALERCGWVTGGQLGSTTSGSTSRRSRRRSTPVSIAPGWRASSPGPGSRAQRGAIRPSTSSTPTPTPAS
jgi:hypothetical protein